MGTLVRTLKLSYNSDTSTAYISDITGDLTLNLYYIALFNGVLGASTAKVSTISGTANLNAAALDYLYPGSSSLKPSRIVYKGTMKASAGAFITNPGSGVATFSINGTQIISLSAAGGTTSATTVTKTVDSLTDTTLASLCNLYKPTYSFSLTNVNSKSATVISEIEITLYYTTDDIYTCSVSQASTALGTSKIYCTTDASKASISQACAGENITVTYTKSSDDPSNLGLYKNNTFISAISLPVTTYSENISSNDTFEIKEILSALNVNITYGSYTHTQSVEGPVLVQYPSNAPTKYIDTSYETATTFTLNCANKLMKGHVLIGNKTLHCGGKWMTSNIVVTII